MQAFADKLVEVVSMEDNFVWLHDYHLLAHLKSFFCF